MKLRAPPQQTIRVQRVSALKLDRKIEKNGPKIGTLHFMQMVIFDCKQASDETLGYGRTGALPYDHTRFLKLFSECILGCASQCAPSTHSENPRPGQC